MALLYRIRDWDRVYETHETRKLLTLRWVAVPNKFDSLGLRRLRKREDASDIFTAWILTLEYASKCTPRGTLVRDGTPISPEDAGDATGFPAEIFKKAWPYLSSQDIGWMEAVNNDLQLFPGEAGENPEDAGSPPANLPLNGMEGREGRDAPPDKPADPRFKEFISIFDNFWKEHRKGKPVYAGKETAQLKKLLDRDKEASPGQFQKALENCLKENWSANNLGLGFVCARFPQLLNYQEKQPFRFKGLTRPMV